MSSVRDDLRGEGYGAIWPAFLGTQRGRLRAHQHDLLPDGAALTEFLAAHGLTPSRRVTDADARRAQVLREAMYEVTSAEYDGRSCGAGDLSAVDDSLQHATPMRVARSAGPLRAQPPADVDEALARIVAEMVSDLTGPRRVQLRACGDDTCSGFFLDASGRRRWCSSGRCGTRMRVRAHRARAGSRTSEVDG